MLFSKISKPYLEITNDIHLGLKFGCCNAENRKGVYIGRMRGARSAPVSLIDKYHNISDLLDKSELSVRRIARITGHSINTVRKIKQLKEI